MTMVLIFSKTLTKSDIEKLSIPAKVLNDFIYFEEGNRAAELKVEDEIGRIWSMRCVIRRQKHRKPVIAAGWKRFARFKGLRIGHQVAFYKVLATDEGAATEGIKHKIQVLNGVRVFGAVVG